MATKTRFLSFFNIFIETNILIALFCLPFSKTILELCAALAVTAYLTKKIFIERSLTPSVDGKTLGALIFFVVFNILSISNTAYFDQSIVAVFSKVFKWCILFLAAAETIRSEKSLNRLLNVMLISCVLILSDAFYQQFITGKDFLHYPGGYPVFKFFDRPHGAITFPTASFPFPNDFASWINVYMFTLAALAVFGRKLKPHLRAIGAVLSLLLMFFLFMAGTRGAIIGAAAAAGLFVLMNIRKFVPYVVISLVIFVIAVAFNPYAKKRVKEIVSIKLSFDDRVGMWTTGVAIWKQHPWIGNGVNTFFQNYKEFRQDEDKGKRGSYAHNCYLQMAADIGILGLMSFLVFLFLVISGCIQKTAAGGGELRYVFVSGLGLGLVAFLIHGSMDTNLYSLNLSGLFWICMGSAYGLNTGKDGNKI